jgi:hypothetical protein
MHLGYILFPSIRNRQKWSVGACDHLLACVLSACAHAHIRAKITDTTCTDSVLLGRPPLELMKPACMSKVVGKFCVILLFWSSIYQLGSQGVKRLPAFQDNMYAQLLMRVVSGSLTPPHDGKIKVESESSVPVRFPSLGTQADLPSPQCGAGVEHSMTSWKLLEKLYDALAATWEEGIPGDFVEAGVWHGIEHDVYVGGASVFAAGVIKQLNISRRVCLFHRLDYVTVYAWSMLKQIDWVMYLIAHRF